jgi:hypothetical protein
MAGRGVSADADRRQVAQNGEATVNDALAVRKATWSTAVGFYEKLGYTIVGDEFLEVTLLHFRMVETA